MPTPRASHGLAAAANGKLYAVGGLASDAFFCPPSGHCRTVEEYDPASNIWALRSPMPMAT